MIYIVVNDFTIFTESKSSEKSTRSYSYKHVSIHNTQIRSAKPGR